MFIDELKKRYKDKIIDNYIRTYRSGFYLEAISFGNKGDKVFSQVIFSVSNKNTYYITKGLDEVYFGSDEKKVIDTLDTLLNIN